MKKIIFGITSLTLGGAERVLVDIANKLVTKFEVTIFTIYSGGELEKQLYNEVKVKSMYQKSYKELTDFEKKWIPFKIFLFKSHLYRNYIKGDYETEIAFLEGPITRLFSTKNKKAKKIAWIHNDISKVFGTGMKANTKNKVDKDIYTKYDQLVFVSRDNLDRFNYVYQNVTGIPHETVIHNYIDSNRVLERAEKNFVNPLKENELNFVTVTRLVEQKGIDRLIRVHAKLIKEKAKHHIYVIGDGPLREELEKKIKEEKVQDTFTLLGSIENPYPYIKNTDFYCLLSNFEGYGITVEEAKILEKNIIITDTAAREAVLDYQDHSLILENTEEAIYEGLHEVIAKRGEILSKEIDYRYHGEKILNKIIETVGEEDENIHTDANI